MGSAGGAGAAQLRALAGDFRRLASPQGLRAKARRNITAAVQPMRQQVQANARAIPANGDGGSTGLREALANATRIQIMTGGRNIAVRLLTDAKRMPAGQQSLPPLMEGERAWRKPVWGNRNAWVSQPSHPFFAPAVPPHLPGVNAGVLAAVDASLAELERGT